MAVTVNHQQPSLPRVAEANLEKDPTTELFTLQNAQLLRANLSGNSGVVARKGSMVAFQGQVEFDHKGSGSLGVLLKKAMSSDDVPLMKVRGTGQAFLANQASSIHLLQLEGDGLTINGRNLLAFTDGLQYDLKMQKNLGIMSSGLWNTTITGHGEAAITSVGTPVVLDCSQEPTYTDIEATVASSTSLTPSIHRTANIKSLIGRGSGEAVQYAFHGPGFVVVQPYEYTPPPSQASSSGPTINLGNLFD